MKTDKYTVKSEKTTSKNNFTADYYLPSACMHIQLRSKAVEAKPQALNYFKTKDLART